MTHRTLLALGGSLRSGSLTTAALRVAAQHARELGAHSELLTVDELGLPLLAPDATPAQHPAAQRLLDTAARADVVLVGTPIYGGTPSGAVKNVLDTMHLGKSGNTGPLAAKRVGVLSVGGGSLTGRFEFQRGATAFLDIACRNLGAWVDPRHVELSELAFDVDGELVDALARAELSDLVDRLIGSASPPLDPAADPTQEAPLTAAVTS